MNHCRLPRSQPRTRWAVTSVLALWLGTEIGPLISANPELEARPSLVVLVGAAGEEEYGQEFLRWAALWEQAGRTAGARLTTLGTGSLGPDPDRDRLEQALRTESLKGPEALWIVLLGHGTFDGQTAKFNLRGPDLSAEDLAAWLKEFRRPLAVIDCTSASAPFIARLSGPDRVVLTATRSGHEQNYARFGQYLAGAITDPQADLDKDGQTSLLEAFLAAARQTAEFYELEGRLATEHALLDDNGDGLGTPSDWFRGLRAVKSPREGAAVDGLRAHQFHLVRSAAEQNMPPPLRVRRDAIELAIARLREQKPQLAEDDYYGQLETLLLELASLYEEADRP